MKNILIPIKHCIFKSLAIAMLINLVYMVELSYAGAVKIEMPDATGRVGDSVAVPIYVTNSLNGIIGVDIKLEYDPGILSAEVVRLGTEINSWYIIGNTEKAGTVKIVLFSSPQGGFLKKPGTFIIAVVNFKVKKAGSSPLNIIDVSFNEMPIRCKKNGNFIALEKNNPPAISDIADQATMQAQATRPIPFTIADDGTEYGNGLTVSAVSSNTSLLPNENIELTGSGPDRSIKLIPAADQKGSTEITVTVSDGELTTSDKFILTVLPIGLTVNIVDGEDATNGTVEISPEKDSYNYLEPVTLTATALAGFKFSGWSGSISGLTNPVTITMDGNKNISARFEAVQYTLLINVDLLKGSVCIDPANAITFNPGERVTITAFANQSYYFTGWSGDVSGSTNPLVITMDTNKIIDANFARDTTPPTVVVKRDWPTINDPLKLTVTATDTESGIESVIIFWCTYDTNLGRSPIVTVPFTQTGPDTYEASIAAEVFKDVYELVYYMRITDKAKNITRPKGHQIIFANRRRP